jgi:hypothetical protein
MIMKKLWRSYRVGVIGPTKLRFFSPFTKFWIVSNRNWLIVTYVCSFSLHHSIHCMLCLTSSEDQYVYRNYLDLVNVVDFAAPELQVRASYNPECRLGSAHGNSCS